MKMHGREISKPNIEVVVIPRSDGDLVFKAQAVLDYTAFEKLCPVPTPPEKMLPGGSHSVDVNDKAYNTKLMEWAGKKTDWMVLESLKATEGLEWATVDYSDHTTWSNYRKEMVGASLSPAEIQRILQAAIDACGLSQEKIDEATERFLAGQAATSAAE